LWRRTRSRFFCGTQKRKKMAAWRADIWNAWSHSTTFGKFVLRLAHASSLGKLGMRMLMLRQAQHEEYVRASHRTPSSLSLPKREGVKNLDSLPATTLTQSSAGNDKRERQRRR
jgi:hypothetical protein